MWAYRPAGNWATRRRGDEATRHVVGMWWACGHEGRRCLRLYWTDRLSLLEGWILAIKHQMIRWLLVGRVLGRFEKKKVVGTVISELGDPITQFQHKWLITTQPSLSYYQVSSRNTFLTLQRPGKRWQMTTWLAKIGIPKVLHKSFEVYPHFQARPY